MRSSLNSDQGSTVYSEQSLYTNQLDLRSGNYISESVKGQVNYLKSLPLSWLPLHLLGKVSPVW